MDIKKDAGVVPAPRRPSRESWWPSFLRSRERETAVRDVRPARHERSEKPSAALEDYLPQALEDREILDCFNFINDTLQSHVDHFYQTSVRGGYQNERPQQSNNCPPFPQSPEPVTVAGMVTSGPEMSSPASRHEEDLARRKDIKRIIAEVLFAGIDPYSEVNNAGSLMPPRATKLLLQLPDEFDAAEDEVCLRALGQWRQITYFLTNHKSVKGKNDVVFEKRLEVKIDEMMQELDQKLEPFIDKANDSKRRTNLMRLAKEVARLGEVLFSQVAHFELRWESEEIVQKLIRSSTIQRRNNPKSDEDRRRRKRPHIHYQATQVRFPGLVKLSDNHGCRLDRPKVLREPQIDVFIRPVARRQTTDLENATRQV